MLGRGGFATVYKGTDEEGNQYAIKFESADRGTVIRECGVYKQLIASNHLIKIHDLGLARDDQSYMIMPVVRFLHFFQWFTVLLLAW